MKEVCMDSFRECPKVWYEVYVLDENDEIMKDDDYIMYDYEEAVKKFAELVDKYL